MTRRLYDFQLHDADAIEAALLSSKSVLYCLPTGGGKTTVADELTRRETERGGSVLFLADRQELVRQAHDRIGGSVLMASYRPTPDTFRPDNPHVTIASVATLARRTEGPDAALVFADEAHLYAAASFSRVLSAYRGSGAKIVGLTATPARLDRQGFTHLFDTFHQGPSSEWLIANGYLVPVDHRSPTGPWWDAVRLSAGDFDAQGLEQAGGAVLKDISARWAALGGILRPTLVFAPTKAYAARLADEFSRLLFLHGLPPAEVITDDTPPAVRRSVRDRIQAGALRVAVTVGVLGTGFDAPAISCIVMARPTLSWSLYLQQGGRGLRTWPGKTDLLLVDCAGNTLRHGYLTKPFSVSLEGPRRKHRRATAGLTTCRECWRIYEWTLPCCPKCGAAKPRGAERRVREVDGELVELTGAEVYAERSREDDKVRTLAKWIREGEERKWNPKAPLCKFKGLFHRWPHSSEIQRARALLGAA